MGSLKTRLLGADDPGWVDILGRLEHDFYHLPSYVSLEAETRGAVAVGCSVEEGDKALFLPLLLSPIPGSEEWHATSPYGYPGPLWSETACRDQGFCGQAIASGLEALRERGATTVFLRLHPILSPEMAIEGLSPEMAIRGHAVRHGETVAVDLTLAEEDQWRQVRKGHRHEINRARRNGLEVVLDDSGRALEEFEEIYHETMQRVGAEEGYFLAPGYVRALHEALGGRLWLGRVRSAGRTLSAALFPETGRLIQFHLSGTREDALHRHASKLMIDGVRRWGAERGCRFLHLGGGVGSSRDGLFDFKAGFSHRRFRFVTWRFVLDPDRYNRLVGDLAPGHDVSDLSGHFPPFSV